MSGLLWKFLMLYLGGQPLYAAPHLLSRGPGAEGAALGPAAVSVVSDPTSLYWNPAGLAGAGGAATGEHLFLYDGARYDFIGLTVPSRLGTFGMGAMQLYRGDIIARNAIDDPGHAVTASQANYMAGYAKGLGERWSAGTTVNVLSSDLAGRKDRGFGADLGARFAAPSDDLWLLGRPRWSAAAVIKNLLAPRLKLDSDPDVLPRELRGGVSVSFDGFSRLSLSAGSVRRDRAMLGVGLSKVLGETELRLGVGAAYTLQDMLTLRLGLDDGFAFGVGFKTSEGRFSVDYALEDRPLARNHRFTVTYRFLRPASATAVPATEVPDEEYVRAKARSESLGAEALTRGRELFKAQRYDEALESLSLAALLRPEDGEARELRRRAVEVRQREDIRGLREKLERQNVARDGEGAYRTLAKLLRHGTADRPYLLDQARQVAARLDAEARESISDALLAEGAADVRTSLSRGLDAEALRDAAWVESLAASTQAVAAARSLKSETLKAAAAHRARLEAAVQGAGKAGQHGRALLAALSLARAYPDDAAASRTLDAARRGYAAPRLASKDRLYLRKLYFLAAVAWSRKDAERARDLLDELRRRDAGDEDAAALMDAMVRAGAVYETFNDNGGAQ